MRFFMQRDSCTRRPQILNEKKRHEALSSEKKKASNINEYVTLIRLKAGDVKVKGG